MPIYEYKCQSCGNIAEFITPKRLNRKIKVCINCGGKMEKIISSSTFHLKGDGWYDAPPGKDKS